MALLSCICVICCYYTRNTRGIVDFVLVQLQMELYDLVHKLRLICESLRWVQEFFWRRYLGS